MQGTENRKYIIILIFIFVGIVLILRLLFMQVIDDKWHKRAAEITEDKITVYPTRGIVYDRHGKKLIANQTYYDINVIPGRVPEDIDSVLFCKIFGISMETYTKKMNAAKAHSYRKPSVIIKAIEAEDFAKVAPYINDFEGFFEQTRTLRTYPQSTAAHVLGYMNEVSKADIEEQPYYKSGDYIGRLGIEQFYEKTLRGKRGIKYYLKDAIGIETGSYQGGKYDTAAIQGDDITITIDAELQAYGEKLMENKIGSIVAIEPSTGEVLALVSSPSYNPNLLVGRKLGSNYLKLEKDSLEPLFNNALNAKYPPGSTFKVFQALIALQEGVITENQTFPCNKDLVGCHNHPTATSVDQAIKFSCNPYFYYTMGRVVQQGKRKSIFADSRIGIQIWAEYMHRFGLGEKLDLDLKGQSAGLIPDSVFYNKMYPPEQGLWAYSTIYSNSIGQGEVEVTPIQMANLAAILANRGYYITPHFIKAIEGGEIPEKYKLKHQTNIDTAYYNLAVEGMRKVVEEPGGTARRARTEGITVCGKTGTAQNHFGEDHSIFMAFAPMDNPKIAISVYIENAGFGGTWAAPIASLMIEKYIKGEITDKKKEQRILEKDFIHPEKEQ